MRKHRYFYTVNGRCVEELVGGKWVPVQEQRALNTHFVISDTMTPTHNPATGKTYDSKSRYERDTRAAGGIIVGNDLSMKGPPKVQKPEPVPVTIDRLNQQKGWNL